MLVPGKTNCLQCGCAVTPGCKCECHEDKRIAELEAALESIRQVCRPQSGGLANLVLSLADAALAGQPKEE